MDIQLAVKYKDGTEVEVSVEYIDCIEFERKFNKPVAAIVSEVVEDDGSLRWRYDSQGRKIEPLSLARAEYLSFLAWTNQHRTNGVELDFEAWLATLSTVEFAAPKAKTSTRSRTRSK